MPNAPAPLTAESKAPNRGRRVGAAATVAAGIVLSRAMGVVRTWALARYLGLSMAAGAFSAALKIPNFLQNLFGEGVLSASFIPVYARLVGQGRKDEADRVAGEVFGLLAVAVAVLVALGEVASPQIVDVVARFDDPQARLLTVRLVRILFPGVGILVLSAWCLGILNSHHRFFLSYAAPVGWNLVIIATLFLFGPSSKGKLESLAVYVSYAAVVGSIVQFGVQLPAVFGLLGRFRPSPSVADESVRQVVRSFGPVVLGRGVVQISAYLDTIYAALLSTRAAAALSYAQAIYLLPISVFGMAVSVAELPKMSQEAGSAEMAENLRNRVNAGLERIAFFLVPSAVAFFFLGDIVSAAILQGGRFGAGDTRYLWYILIGGTVGLLAQGLGRLYASTFYALGDARTPLYFATLRVALTAVLAYWAALRLPKDLGIPNELGAVGITATTGVAAWVEFVLLRRKLGQRIGKTGVPRRRLFVLWFAALVAALAAVAIKFGLVQRFGTPAAGEWGPTWLPAPALHPWATAIVVLIPFGALYFGLTFAFRVPTSLEVVRRIIPSRPSKLS